MHKMHDMQKAKKEILIKHFKKMFCEKNYLCNLQYCQLPGMNTQLQKWRATAAVSYLWLLLWCISRDVHH